MGLPQFWNGEVRPPHMRGRNEIGHFLAGWADWQAGAEEQAWMGGVNSH